MSTYSQLKLQNDELVQKQNQLCSGTVFNHKKFFQCEFSFKYLWLEQSLVDSSEPSAFNIEVLVIPSGESKEALRKTTLYHHIPIEDGQIPTFSADDCYSDQGIIEEPYEEQYGNKHFILLFLTFIYYYKKN